MKKIILASALAVGLISASSIQSAEAGHRGSSSFFSFSFGTPVYQPVYQPVYYSRPIYYSPAPYYYRPHYKPYRYHYKPYRYHGHNKHYGHGRGHGRGHGHRR